MIELAQPLALLLLPLPLLARLWPARAATAQAMALPQGVAALAVPAPGPRRWRGLALVAGVWLGLCCFI